MRPSSSSYSSSSFRYADTNDAVRLLGWSAFAGFIVLFIGWPVNSLLTRYSIAIQKELLAARDKRMNIVNELVSAVKFIKFFAWEDRWMNRAMGARNEELKWQWKCTCLVLCL